jgi:type VI secretion system secreted protein Hcp
MAADNFLFFPDKAKGGMLSSANAKPEGESTDDVFSKKKAVEIKSFSFSVSQAQTAGSATGGASAGKAKFEKIVIVKDVDQSSAPLFGGCVAGAHFPSMMIVVRKPGGSNLLYLQYVFLQVFVTKIAWSGGGGEANPEENIEFVFGAMGMQYIQQKGDGQAGEKRIGYWSVTSNAPNMVVPAGNQAPPWMDA